MSEIQCIRKACIEDPNDLYHVESHMCFVCGAEFGPDAKMMERICPVCAWYQCPTCGGCKCSLSKVDATWVDRIRGTYCQDRELMAAIDVGALPDTENPNVKAGLGVQLRFCRRWVIEQQRSGV